MYWKERRLKRLQHYTSNTVVKLGKIREHNGPAILVHLLFVTRSNILYSLAAETPHHWIVVAVVVADGLEMPASRSKQPDARR